MSPPPGREQHYWLVKTEPDEFSWTDLWTSPDRSARWDGVRNYQARNFLRDGMKRGDLVLVYHSGTKAPAVMGVAEVVREAYPDPTAFDPRHPGYDPKANRDDPAWVTVELRARRPCPTPIPLATLRETAGLEEMTLLQRGSRLSVQPVTAAEWEIIERMCIGTGARSRKPSA